MAKAATPPDRSVTVDYWENQRYKPLGVGWAGLGAWTAEGMPLYTDVSGESLVPCDDATNKPAVFLPLGWQWSTDDWAVDMSTRYGTVDDEGWSYGSTFEALVGMSLKKNMSNEVGRFSMVRRRRWCRARYCVTEEAKQEFDTQVKWIHALCKKLDNLRDEKAADEAVVMHYEHRRRSVYETVVQCADQSLRMTAKTKDDVVERLELVKTFLLERCMIEKDYTVRLRSLAGKYIDAGESTAVSGSGLVSEILSGPVLAPTGPYTSTPTAEYGSHSGVASPVMESRKSAKPPRESKGKGSNNNNPQEILLDSIPRDSDLDAHPHKSPANVLPPSRSSKQRLSSTEAAQGILESSASMFFQTLNGAAFAAAEAVREFSDLIIGNAQHGDIDSMNIDIKNSQGDCMREVPKLFRALLGKEAGVRDVLKHYRGVLQLSQSVDSSLQQSLRQSLYECSATRPMGDTYFLNKKAKQSIDGVGCNNELLGDASSSAPDGFQSPEHVDVLTAAHTITSATAKVTSDMVGIGGELVAMSFGYKPPSSRTSKSTTPALTRSNSAKIARNALDPYDMQLTNPDDIVDQHLHYRAARKPHVYDVWLALHGYRRACEEADAALFIYNAYAAQQRRETTATAKRVKLLLGNMTSAIMEEQCKLWRRSMSTIQDLVLQANDSRSFQCDRRKRSQMKDTEAYRERISAASQMRGEFGMEGRSAHQLTPAAQMIPPQTPLQGDVLVVASEIKLKAIEVEASSSQHSYSGHASNVRTHLVTPSAEPSRAPSGGSSRSSTPRRRRKQRFNVSSTPTNGVFGSRRSVDAGELTRNGIVLGSDIAAETMEGDVVDSGIAAIVDPKSDIPVATVDALVRGIESSVYDSTTSVAAEVASSEQHICRDANTVSTPSSSSTSHAPFAGPSASDTVPNQHAKMVSKERTQCVSEGIHFHRSSRAVDANLPGKMSTPSIASASKMSAKSGGSAQLCDFEEIEYDLDITEDSPFFRDDALKHRVGRDSEKDYEYDSGEEYSDDSDEYENADEAATILAYKPQLLPMSALCVRAVRVGRVNWAVIAVDVYQSLHKSAKQDARGFERTGMATGEALHPWNAHLKRHSTHAHAGRGTQELEPASRSSEGSGGGPHGNNTASLQDQNFVELAIEQSLKLGSAFLGGEGMRVLDIDSDSDEDSKKNAYVDAADLHREDSFLPTISSYTKEDAQNTWKTSNSMMDEASSSRTDLRRGLPSGAVSNDAPIEGYIGQGAAGTDSAGDVTKNVAYSLQSIRWNEGVAAITNDTFLHLYSYDAHMEHSALDKPVDMQAKEVNDFGPGRRGSGGGYEDMVCGWVSEEPLVSVDITEAEVLPSALPIHDHGDQHQGIVSLRPRSTQSIHIPAESIKRCGRLGVSLGVNTRYIVLIYPVVDIDSAGDTVSPQTDLQTQKHGPTVSRDAVGVDGIAGGGSGGEDAHTVGPACHPMPNAMPTCINPAPGPTSSSSSPYIEEATSWMRVLANPFSIDNPVMEKPRTNSTSDIRSVQQSLVKSMYIPRRSVKGIFE